MLIELSSIGFTINMLPDLQMVTKCTYIDISFCNLLPYTSSTVITYVILADELMSLSLDMIDHPNVITLAKSISMVSISTKHRRFA